MHHRWYMYHRWCLRTPALCIQALHATLYRTFHFVIQTPRPLLPPVAARGTWSDVTVNKRKEKHGSNDTAQLCVFCPVFVLMMALKESASIVCGLWHPQGVF
ncbi:hypothetical protein C7M84_014413 [Penaeus vannamei]|uniref:Uncharacterized protein n=1 Tax=Penaeus vannamei TaxID=6689 RepID=A0A423STI2_PENVA|nr:hypothetical protein C7M84_014413 [Penaeus vannamei]